MNSKVLKTMIMLCWLFLGVFAILKTFWADYFAIAVNNETLIAIGQFIDERVWLQQIFYGFTTLLTYHFYLCACCHRWYLSWKQYIVLCLIVAVTNIFKFYVPAYALYVNVLLMVAIPYFLKSDFRTVVIIFLTHYVGQIAISFIRGAEISLVDINTVSQLVCGLDAYIWLLLYYLYSNLYKEKIFMGNFMPPIWGTPSKEAIQREIDKIDRKLVDCTDDKKRAKYETKRAEYESLLENCSDEN